jgi:hypothetical protein
VIRSDIARNFLWGALPGNFQNFALVPVFFEKFPKSINYMLLSNV